jgi:hypothetical protein
VTKSGIFISGGKDPLGTCGRFTIGDRHTAYEWAMVLADGHPYSAFLNAWIGNKAPVRLRVIESLEKPAAIYRAIESALATGEITALPAPKQNWYDPPIEPDDPTQRIYDVAAMLTVIRGLGAEGRVINKLLAQQSGPEQNDHQNHPNTRREEEPAEPVESKPVETAPGRRGRRKGSGKIDDGPALREMLKHLAAGAPSIFNAADKAAPPHPGNALRDSIRRRLARKFRSAFGKEPPAGRTWKDFEQELNSNSPHK